MYGNAAAWGPMFLLGLTSLSEIFEGSASFYIEHGLSNLMMPAYLWGVYALWEAYVADMTWRSGGIFCGYLLVSIITARY